MQGHGPAQCEAHWAKAHWLMVRGMRLQQTINAAVSAGFQKNAPSLRAVGLPR
jgi:hypothetical protein